MGEKKTPGHLELRRPGDSPNSSAFVLGVPSSSNCKRSHGYKVILVGGLEHFLFSIIPTSILRASMICHG